MLQNYFKIAWRNIAKNWFYSGINVLGLSIGIGFSLLIAAFIWNEMGVNKDLKNAAQQYIIQSKWKDPAMGFELATVGPLAKSLKEEYPGLVANYYRFDGITSNVSRGDKVFREGIQIGDSTVLQTFGFPLLHGNPATALSQPFAIVISEEKAIKYFGRTDVIGETLTIESFSGSKNDFVITGVMKKGKENSITHLNGSNDNQLLLPLSSLSFFGRVIEQWNNPYVVGFIELKPGVNPKSMEQPMKALLSRNAPDIAQNMSPYLVPVSSYYLEKDNGRVRKMLYTVSFIALFILLMAIVNFVNVSVSKSSTRIREVGVRKVMGGLRTQLVLQFLMESLILVFFATLLGMGIYELARPFFSGVLGKAIPPFGAFPPVCIFILSAWVLCIGMITGIYPALALSSLKAAVAIKGKLKTVGDNIVLRKSLVGFQFFTASIVLTGALVITRQVSLFFNKDLGYDKAFVVSAQVPRNWTTEGLRHMKAIRDEFASLPEVSNASIAWQIPNGWNLGNAQLYPEGQDSTQTVASELLTTDENYLDTYKMHLSAGRFFRSHDDSTHIVLNETAAKGLGWKDPADAVGKWVRFRGSNRQMVIGVVNDFHFGTMKEAIKPAALLNLELNKNFRFLSFKLKPGNLAHSIEALQRKWSMLLPGTAFEYHFMDDSLRELYQSEIQLKKAIQLATVLSLVIVLLGIIALVSLSIQKRTAEIGIRKVLGASPAGIIVLFLKDFVPVILLGGAVAIPVAWYLLHGWLSDYAYRISLGVGPFLLSIIVLGMLASMLIALQIVRASAENPIKNLRTE